MIAIFGVLLLWGALADVAANPPPRRPLPAKESEYIIVLESQVTATYTVGIIDPK